jgi:hypothetical protein
VHARRSRSSARTPWGPREGTSSDLHNHRDRREQEHEQGPALARAGPFLPEGVAVPPSVHRVRVRESCLTLALERLQVRRAEGLAAAALSSPRSVWRGRPRWPPEPGRLAANPGDSRVHSPGQAPSIAEDCGLPHSRALPPPPQRPRSTQGAARCRESRGRNFSVM